MASLRLVRGIPGAGKSSFAKAWVEDDHTNRARVSRDDIRTMLYGYPRNPIDFSREDEVTAIEEAAVRAGLKAGKDVLVDATHLRAKYIRKWNDLHPLTEVIDFEVDVDEAVRRDVHRMYPVGEVVIREMAQKFLKKGKLPPLPDLSAPAPQRYNSYTRDPSLPTAYVVDLDGTLAQHHRSPYDYDSLHTDTLDKSVADTIYALDLENKIIAVSGRPDSHREQTLQWLRDNHVHVDELHMRKTGDKRKDTIIKSEIFDKEIAPRYDVVAAFDDRNSVVQMWRDKGVKCFQVQLGDF